MIVVVLWSFSAAGATQVCDLQVISLTFSHLLSHMIVAAARVPFSVFTGPMCVVELSIEQLQWSLGQQVT